MRKLAVTMLFVTGMSQYTAAQSFDAVGTRAAGMSGAFVAVADDASAVYWNPGGLATGSYFSLMLDRTETQTDPAGDPSAGSQSGFLLSLSAPALGLSYYRLRSTVLGLPDLATANAELGRGISGQDAVHVQTLITHHVGATVVQSIVEGLAVGATLKLVRGVAASAIVSNRDREELLGEGANLVGRASNKIDADVGLMASSGRLRLGLTVRNLSEPEFETASTGTAIVLERQARVGAAVVPLEGWIVAADLDLLRTTGPFGDMRDLALGTEGRLSRRVFARAGVRLNTVDDGDRAPSASLGASYAVKGSVMVDGHITTGWNRGAGGWGVAARFVY